MFRNILFPTDGSSAATHAIARSARLAKDMPGIQVTILIAVATRAVDETDESEEWLARENARLQENAQETLATTARLFTEVGICPMTLILSGKPASSVIIEEAARGTYDLIVMASRGLGTDRTERHYLGSVTENVLRKVTQPVLVMPIHSDGRLYLMQGAIK